MSYAYDDDARTVELTERNGSKVTYVHDEKYRDTRHIHPDGEELFEYNTKNLKTKVTDKLGNVTRMTYDSRGNLLETTRRYGYIGT